jgi:hypothetical protein
MRLLCSLLITVSQPQFEKYRRAQIKRDTWKHILASSAYIAFDFTHRVTALALTDSVHSKTNIKGQPVIEWFNRHSQHWVASKETLDKVMPYHTKDSGCPCVSAGQSPHSCLIIAAFPKQLILKYHFTFKFRSFKA